MNQEESALLEKEKARGRRAESAFEEFIKPFIESRRQKLFNAFQIIDVNDISNLQEIRRMFAVLSALEIELTEIITSGKLASISLENAMAP